MIEILAAAAPGGEVPKSGSWTLLIIFFCLSIFVSFVCSIFEAVLLSVTQPYIASLKKTKAEAGKRLQHLKDHVDAPLTSILTLNTVAHTVGAIGVGNQAGGVASQQFPDSVALFVNIVTAITTVAVLILSEIIPKTIGATHWRSLAPVVGLMLEKLTWAMTPIVWLIGLFSKGGHSKAEFSREELKVMAEMGRKAGKLREDESRILTNLLQLRESKVRDVMTPRVVVFSLPQDNTVDEFMQQHAETPFSRILLYDENHDDVVGFALKDDILLAAARDDDDLKLSKLVREATRLPATQTLAKALDQMMQDRSHLALILDEFGGLAGLVTMEDIMETLLGLEIVDEADTEEDMQAWARTLWERRAKKMGIELEKPEEERAPDDKKTNGN